MDLLIQDAIRYFLFVKREESKSSGQPWIRPTSQSTSFTLQIAFKE